MKHYSQLTSEQRYQIYALLKLQPYSNRNSGGDLHTHLRCKKKNRKRYGAYDRRGTLINQVSIDDRLAIVDKRLREGDWELDTIIGKNHKQAIVSITERVRRLRYLYKVTSKDAKSVGRAIVKKLKAAGLPVLTITSDNGREFGDNETIAENLSADFFLCIRIAHGSAVLMKIPMA